jgi:hypothetical protein
VTKSLAAASITALLLLSGAPAFAQGVAGPANEPRVNQLIIYGSDSCPPSTDNEIIVCARKPEGDRYRIPENLRTDPNDPRSESWANRAIELSYVGRTGTESCSTVGPGGFTGCFAQIAREARADRATRDSVNWNRLIEEARQERLSRIDADAAADEAADPNPSPIPPPNR